MNIIPFSGRTICNYHPVETKQYGADISYCSRRDCTECLISESILVQSWRYRLFKRILEIEPWN